MGVLALLSTPWGGRRCFRHTITCGWSLPPSAGNQRARNLVFHSPDGRPSENAKRNGRCKRNGLSRFDLYGDRIRRGATCWQRCQDNQMPTAKVRMEGGSALVVMDRKPRRSRWSRRSSTSILPTEGLDADHRATSPARADRHRRAGRVYTRFLENAHSGR